jgi:hypothetical protein
MNNEKLYTAADFASYHAGNMPAQDMHALEKAALEDPFLSDALDGYAYANTAVADTVSLNEKLAIKEKAEAKVLSFSSNKTWLRAAASIAIIFGLGYLFYGINKKEEITKVAKNEVRQEPKIDSANAQVDKIDSQINTIVAEGTIAEAKNNNTVSDVKLKFDSTRKQFADNRLSTTPSTVTLQAPAAPAIAKAGEVTLESEVAKSLRRDINTEVLEKQEGNKNLSQNNQSQNNASNYYNYNGVVQTASGGPMQNATIKLRNSNVAIQTDTRGRFNFRATDSVANISIAAVGYDKKEVLLNSNASQILRLDNKSTNLDEVVVTGYGARAKKSITGNSTTISEKKLEGKVAGVKVSNDAYDRNIALKKTKALNIDSVRFNTEKQSFYNYLQQNIKPEFDDNGNEYKGTVILSFITNKKGKPIKIKVEKSFNDACNEQAITLLQQGPRWSKNLEERKRVEIQF